MGFRSDQLVVWFMFILLSPRGSLANDEGDVLLAFKSGLKDPNAVLISWNPTLVNPCTWFHITCDPSNNRVTRIDLGNAGLSGPLDKKLGSLKNLQYPELFGNHFTGHIPPELGNLTKLVSLDLYSNSLTGNLPVELGNLWNARFMQIYPGNKYLCNPFKNKYCVPGCCKFCK